MELTSVRGRGAAHVVPLRDDEFCVARRRERVAGREGRAHRALALRRPAPWTRRAPAACRAPDTRHARRASAISSIRQLQECSAREFLLIGYNAGWSDGAIGHHQSLTLARTLHLRLQTAGVAAALAAARAAGPLQPQHAAGSVNITS